MNKNLLRTFLISTILLSSSGLIAQKHNINITDFTVCAKEQKVIIDWKTDGATATNYFAVQKSIDGVNFKTVALVLGPDPKQKDDSYAFSDKYVPKTAKHSYYRLVHVDAEGNEQVSDAKILAKP
jgi:hypothetical protein